MKKHILLSIMTLILIVSVVIYKHSMQADAGRGAALGGITGATIGSAFSDRGAAIGAGVGLLGGAIIGAASSNKYKNRKRVERDEAFDEDEENEYSEEDEDYYPRKRYRR